MDVEAVMPLTVFKKLTAVIFLGKKGSDHLYNHNDIALLQKIQRKIAQHLTFTASLIQSEKNMQKEILRRQRQYHKNMLSTLIGLETCLT